MIPLRSAHHGVSRCQTTLTAIGRDAGTHPAARLSTTCTAPPSTEHIHVGPNARASTRSSRKDSNQHTLRRSSQKTDDRNAFDAFAGAALNKQLCTSRSQNLTGHCVPTVSTYEHAKQHEKQCPDSSKSVGSPLARLHGVTQTKAFARHDTITNPNTVYDLVISCSLQSGIEMICQVFDLRRPTSLNAIQPVSHCVTRNHPVVIYLAEFPVKKRRLNGLPQRQCVTCASPRVRVPIS